MCLRRRRAAGRQAKGRYVSSAGRGPSSSFWGQLEGAAVGLLRCAALGVLMLALAACSARDAGYQQSIYVFGTIVDVTLWGVAPQRAREAVAALETDFRTMHHDWHAWHPGPLMDLNRAIAEGRAVAVKPSLIDLIVQSQAAYRASEGMFNPAAGKLFALWGFHSDEPPSGPPPTEAQIAALVAAHPTMDDIQVEGDKVASRNPAVELDFGAIAKGYAGDLAVARLRRMGIDNAMINTGGGIRVIGRHGDRPWRVGIRHPQGNGIVAALEVGPDEAVHTSGNYERYREYRGKRYQHIIDTRTGMPVEGVTSVTVISPSGSLADAAATALVVAGPRNWERIAHRMGVDQVLLVAEDGTVYLTPAMERRVRFEGERPKHIVVRDPGAPAAALQPR